MVGLGRAPVPAQRPGTVAAGRLLPFQRPGRMFVALVFSLVYGAGDAGNTGGVNAAGCFLALNRVVANDFGGDGPLKLDAQATPGPGGIPKAEQQRRGADAEYAGGIVSAGIIQQLASVGGAEHFAVQPAVPEQGVGDAVRRFQAGYRELAGQVIPVKPNFQQGQVNQPGTAGGQQGQLHPVGLAGYGVQQHALLDFSGCGYNALLGGVLPTFVGGREYLVAGAAGWLVSGDASESGGVAGRRFLQNLQIE